MNKQDLNYEQQIAVLCGSKTWWTFYPKDLVWYRNYQLGNKWEKGTIVKQVGPVAYLIGNFPEHFSEAHCSITCCFYEHWSQ